MWYNILIEKEFVDFFSNASDELYVIKDGKESLAPTFERFYDVIEGLMIALSFPGVSPNLSLSVSNGWHVREGFPKKRTA